MHLLTDALGRPLRLALSGGQAAEISSAPALLEGLRAGALIADRAYDANSLRALLAKAGIQAVIPSRRLRKVLIAHDKLLYKERNRIERTFNKLKHLRRIATRYDRRALHFLSFLHLASSLLWLR